MPSYPLVRHRLGNGLRVVVNPDHNVPGAALVLMCDVGSRHEQHGLTGLAHLFEHLLMSGASPGIPTGGYAALLVGLGAEFNAATSPDMTLMYQVLPAGGVETGLWALGDRVCGVGEALDQDVLDTQRRAIDQEYRQRVRGVPFGTQGERAAGLLFPGGHPYARTPFGNMTDLEHVALDDVKAFFAAHYTATNLVLAVCGDTDPQQIIGWAERYLGPVPAVAPPHDAVPPVAGPGVLGPLSAPRRLELAEPVPFAMVSLLFRLPPGSREPAADIHAADLALRVLAGGTSSRLHRSLVDAGLAQRTTGLVRPGHAGVSTGMIALPLAPGVDAGDVEKVVAAELDRLAEHGVSGGELERAKAVCERELLEELAGLNERAMTVAEATMAFDDPDLINTAAARMRAVTPEQVRRIASAWLRPAHAATLVYRPDDDGGGEPTPTAGPAGG